MKTVQPLMKASANSLIDLVSARSSFMQTTLSLPDASTTSLAAACALSMSRQAMMILAPGGKRTLGRQRIGREGKQACALNYKRTATPCDKNRVLHFKTISHF